MAGTESGKLPVLSKQHVSIFPAKGILKGSVQ
jgi:hypothetical protein